MKASEGKLGRVFLVTFEDGEQPADAIERFAVEHGVQAAQVAILGGAPLAGMLTPDADGRPGLTLCGDAAGRSGWSGAQAVIQEVLGLAFRRVRDDAGRETLFKVQVSKTRVMEKPAPAPEESGPGTIPVYLFNAEFN